VALRTNEITGTIAAKSSYGGTIQCSTVPFNRTTLFQLSGYLCEDKWLNKGNAQINIQSMIFTREKKMK